MLAVALLFCVSQVAAIPLANFYPFGTSAGGNTLGPTDDGRSQIALNEPFLYFGTYYTNLTVSNNGFITTSESYGQFSPLRFNAVFVPLIAPYWADVDTESSGGGLVWYRVSTSQADRDRARNDIRAVFQEAARFTPTVVFIATWDHVGYYDDHIDRTNTFQSILASDGSQSYVIFLYADGLIQWTTGDSHGGSNGFGGNQAHVGLTSGNGVDFITHEYSFTSQVVNIENARVPDSVMADGVLMYRVDGSPDPLAIGLTAAQLTSTTLCIGDDVTYTCNIDSLTHIWNFGELTGTVSLGDPLYTPHSVHVFTLERVFGNSSSSIVSTLSVTAFAGLNGTQISCRDGNVTEDEAERQMTIVMLFDPPSSPSLTVVAESLQQIIFTISPPSYASQCVLNYTITATSSDGSVVSNITVEVSDNITLREGGFEFCNNVYNFTVVANTLAGPTQRSAVVTSPEVAHFLTPTLHLAASESTVSITGTEPTNLMSSTVSIQRSSPDSDSCEESVVNQMTSGSSPVTVMDTLSCRYAGHRVTYCLQFRTDECQSNVATETINVPMRLLLSLHRIFSSTSESVSILVNVDEQTNCDGVEGLTITATLTEGNLIISTQQTHYSDTVITFRSISAGDYTCSVTVEDETGPVESLHIPCKVDEDYVTESTVVMSVENVTESPVVTNVIVGVVSSVCFLIIGVLIGVLATVTSQKCKKTSHEAESQSPATLAPHVYEEVEIKVRKKEAFQLEENSAYGHVK